MTSRQKKAGPPPVAEGPSPRTWRGFTLNPFQIEAVAAIEAARSVLVSAPTGAGKTLVAEYAIELTLKRGKEAIYTAPVKALSNQKYRDFRATLGPDVGIMTGDVTINPGARLLIMTTEIFRNTIFEQPEALDAVDYVIFDEIHYMDDLERGTVWEESVIFAPQHLRFICLSATVSNLAQFGEWISMARGDEVKVIRAVDRPVPLTHYFFFPHYGLMRADKAHAFPPRAKRGRTRRHVEPLLDHLQREQKLPVLYFCFSRRECEQRARSSNRRGLLSGVDRQRMATFFDEICDLFEIEPDPHLEELRALANEGVAYHHAGLLPLHKELVERLFTSGLLKLLYTTETFALGINMPARTVVFSSLRKFDGVTFDILKARDYQQMAGRAGRQGIDTDGLVYSVIDDERIPAAGARKVVFGSIEPIQSRFNLSYSTLINLHGRLGQRIYEAWERSFNNFQWSRMSRKKRERNAQRQREAILKRLTLLEEFGYIDAGTVLEKGRTAALINGYELQATELLFSGLLQWLDEVQINVTMAALVFEERRSDLYRRLDSSVLREHRTDIERLIERIIVRERELGIRASVRRPNFKIGSVVHVWSRGADFEDLADYTNASQGDLVRTIRLTIQLLRQLRKALPVRSDLAEKLGRCVEIINRDVVDAKRQLELGN
ncbi:MAG: DEAD/DEAH box helicase [Planctomycetota bacterium]